MTTNGSEVAPRIYPLQLYVDSFRDHLHVNGYAPQSVTNKRSIAIAFARWSQGERIGVDDLSEDHLATFVKRRPPRPTSAVEMRTLRQFLTHLRVKRGLPVVAEGKPASPIDDLTQRYVCYLRTGRGLAENSVLIYTPCVRDFLAYRLAKTGSLALETLDAETIRAFLLERIAHRSSESSRLLAVALRSLLRFLFLRGETPRDLSPAVPMVRTYRQSGVPALLSPEEVERVLSTPDQSTTRGRRDHAILLLLARLGLRAGEIVPLELSDVRWRTGELVVRGKGLRLDHMPLLDDVGEALALYLRKDRGASTSRRVFLRLIPPRVGLTGPASIDHIVRLALARADVRPRHGRVAHLFRHSLATRMIRHGASIAEIAEVLRHRSQSTTAVYAKVSFEALRTVARPWPVKGGAR
jgi:site-specific recombinase XerD